ncbi:unnamed protein product [Calicophoron daubneyi]|uniref:Golgin-84 n=1 Tax=Calicophoron daubneyi TaxID=300641 RepID=A0AAV2TVG8_CALDB
MSWLSELANRAENLLNTIDNSAAEALNRPASRENENVWHMDPERSISPTNRAISDHYPYTVAPSKPSVNRERVENLNKSIPDARPPPIVSTEVSEQWDPIEFSVPAHQNVRPRSRGRNTETAASVAVVVHKSDSPTRLQTDSVDRQQRVANDSASHTDRDERLSRSSGYETLDSRGHASGTVESGAGAQKSTKYSPSTKIVSVQETASDIRLENKLLRSEVSSMSQEISDLLKRNHRASEENKELRGQLERLGKRLRDSDCQVRELQVQVKELEANQTPGSATDQAVHVSQNQAVLTASEMERLKTQLEASRKTITTLEASVQEARRQNSLTENRAQLAQRESARISQELAQYKEKATHILCMKEKLIASLRGEDTSMTDGESDHRGGQVEESADEKLISTIRAECEMLREEASRWKIEVDNRELTMQELDVQMQAERESLRRNLELAEQQAEREKQLREDADTESAHMRRRLREMEESFGRSKADLHAQLMNNEIELNRLRQLLARRQSSSSSGNSIVSANSSERIDPEHVLTLESRLRQLTDNLLTKQDALDSVLSQNHALKIRLEHFQTENESLTSALSNEEGHTDLRFRTPLQYGCTRLNTSTSPTPRVLRPAVVWMDGLTIRATNTLRRWPLTRCIFFAYLLFLHLWLLFFALTSHKVVTQDGGARVPLPIPAPAPPK